MDSKSNLGFRDLQIEKLKNSLSPEHLIYIMISEHEKIFHLLESLFTINQNIQNCETYNEARPDIIRLNRIINLLIKSDLHHQREELILFPQLEKFGVFGHPYVKTLEHENIRDYLDELLTISEKMDESKFDNWSKRINTLVKFLIVKLRENMEDENNSIYPKAVEVITDNEIWKKMKLKSDKLGYCKF